MTESVINDLYQQEMREDIQNAMQIALTEPERHKKRLAEAHLNINCQPVKNVVYCRYGKP